MLNYFHPHPSHSVPIPTQNNQPAMSRATESPVVTPINNENTPKNHASVVKLTTSRELLRMLGPQALSRLGGLFSAWNARNANLPQEEKLSFTDWVADRDDLTKLNKRLDEEVECLEAHLEMQSNAHKSFVGKLVGDMAQKHQNLVAELESLTKKVALLEGARGDREEAETDEEANVTLKKPRSQEEFNAVRMILYKFNKANFKRQSEGKEVLKWGESEEFSMINTEDSLVAWLKTVHASTCSLGADTIEHFKVCVFRGKLVTLSKDYEDGVGVEALWMPDSKYDDVCKQSTRYKSKAHRQNDPRHGYELNGVKWTPKAYKKSSKKRKLADNTK